MVVVMTGQSKWMSLIEANVTSWIGFCVAIMANRYVLPWFGFEATWSDSLWITVIFTIISIGRVYAVRRTFAWYQERKI